MSFKLDKNWYQYQNYIIPRLRLVPALKLEPTIKLVSAPTIKLVPAPKLLPRLKLVLAPKLVPTIKLVPAPKLVPTIKLVPAPTMELALPPKLVPTMKLVPVPIYGQALKQFFEEVTLHFYTSLTTRIDVIKIQSSHRQAFTKERNFKKSSCESEIPHPPFPFRILMS
jgi:hypothetical protein